MSEDRDSNQAASGSLPSSDRFCREQRCTPTLNDRVADKPVVRYVIEAGWKGLPVESRAFASA